MRLGDRLTKKGKTRKFCRQRKQADKEGQKREGQNEKQKIRYCF